MPTDPREGVITLTPDVERQFKAQDIQRVGTAVMQDVAGKKDPYSYDPIPASIRKDLNTIGYYVFSISPKRQTVYHGSYGTFNLMECPKGKPYIITATVPKMVDEWINRGDYKKSYNLTEGKLRVEALLMPGKPGESTDMTRWGFFYGTEPIPTQAQLDEAHAKVVKTMSSLVKTADILYRNDKTRHQIMPVHLLAAEYLKVVRPWYQDVAEQRYCPACLVPVHVKAAICPNGDVLYWNAAFRYGRVTKEQFDLAVENGWVEE